MQTRDLAMSLVLIVALAQVNADTSACATVTYRLVEASPLLLECYERDEHECG